MHHLHFIHRISPHCARGSSPLIINVRVLFAMSESACCQLIILTKPILAHSQNIRTTKRLRPGQQPGEFTKLVTRQLVLPLLIGMGMLFSRSKSEYPRANTIPFWTLKVSMNKQNQARQKSDIGLILVVSFLIQSRSRQSRTCWTLSKVIGMPAARHFRSMTMYAFY